MNTESEQLTATEAKAVTAKHPPKVAVVDAEPVATEPPHIVIDDEFSVFLPDPSNEERAELEASLLRDGCREPLTLWGNILIDGHNRHSICTRLGIPFKIVSIECSSRDDAKVWVIRNQISRRNINAYQRTRLVLELEDIIAARAKENQRAAGGDKALLQNSAKAVEPVNTREELAKLAGVSRDTIAKVKKIKEKAPAELKEKVRTGEVSINKAHQELKEAKTTSPTKEPNIQSAAPPNDATQRPSSRRRTPPPSTVQIDYGEEIAMKVISMMGQLRDDDKSALSGLQQMRDYCNKRIAGVIMKSPDAIRKQFEDTAYGRYLERCDLLFHEDTPYSDPWTMLLTGTVIHCLNLMVGHPDPKKARRLLDDIEWELGRRCRQIEAKPQEEATAA